MTAQRKRVLVIDDNRGVFIGLRAAMRADGRLEAVGPARGLAEAAALADGAHAATLDLTLTDSEGTDTARRFRAAHPDLPVVLYTGAVLAEQAAAYVNATITKGRIDELMDALAELTGAAPAD